MTKVIIEIDIKEGWKIPRVEDMQMLANPDWLIDAWHIEDVQSVNPDLNDTEAREVLRRVKKYRDCENGINWAVIDSHACDVYNERD